jgi:hypothetical protein
MVAVTGFEFAVFLIVGMMIIMLVFLLAALRQIDKSIRRRP